MIFDTLEHSALYEHLGAGFARGFRYLQAFKPDTPDGRYELDGANVFALVQGYATTPAAGKKFESHRTYIDLQYVADGEELIQYAPIAALTVDTPYVAKDDYLLYRDFAPATSLIFAPRHFALFYPNDGHKPCCCVTAPVKVRKVVVKIRV
ncbi:MAG: YhcH/YjgK/YiaL family protein [Verrucomicrobia bacterium]|nr:YhcH/YjgK/YiaL family protein [Verrucomicrobiota bacterium]